MSPMKAMTMTVTRTAEPGSRSEPRIALTPAPKFPEDRALPELPQLLDGELVWRTYCREYGEPESPPRRLRLRQFTHSPGRAAGAIYETEWEEEKFLPSGQFAIQIRSGGPLELFRYPDDSRLPGLSQAASPDSALRLLNAYVLPMSARRARVDLIRYRPSSRAVLRHRAGGVGFFLRVMRPEASEQLLAALEVMGQSDFVTPRLAGSWQDGGCAWFSAIPGRNLRDEIRRGRLPDARSLLDGLQSLWAVPLDRSASKPFDLAGTYLRAKRSLRHYSLHSASLTAMLEDAVQSLDRFARQWRPTAIAHNDFYDDQMLALDDGRIAVVDFEETGPGDPQLDVGNFLAHMNWAHHFGHNRSARAAGAFHRVLREAALECLGWAERDLNYREAICLFRMCTNVIRRPTADWLDRLQSGLQLVNETMG